MVQIGGAFLFLAQHFAPQTTHSCSLSILASLPSAMVSIEPGGAPGKYLKVIAG